MEDNSTIILDWKLAFAPPPKTLALLFRKPEVRPPVYEEMVGDMGNIINKVIAPYVSQSCMELHFEELVAECWSKTARMNSEGLIDRCRTRCEYFKQYKTAIANHVCSLVQKYVFTEKRTGVKPPPKDKRRITTEHVSRPLEVRIDDPDSNIQVSENGDADDSKAFRELMEEVSVRLNYLELGVLNQLVSPDEASLFYARQEAEIGRTINSPLRVRIRQEHLARGLGISLELFRQTHESIKRKCLFMKSNEEQRDQRYATAMATLMQFFGIQIPRSIDEIARKRALMIAARHQFDLLEKNEGMKEHMKVCNIPIPEVRNDRFTCFGVMYQKHHRTCENCGVKDACEVKAANFGIGEITISHKLLGSRNVRVPVVRPSHVPALTDSREEEILAFLDENLRRVEGDNAIIYRHRDRTATPSVGNELPILILEGVSPLRLRFINPAEELKPTLSPESTKKGGRRAWMLPAKLSLEESLNLIRTHAQLTLMRT